LSNKELWRKLILTHSLFLVREGITKKTDSLKALTTETKMATRKLTYLDIGNNKITDRGAPNRLFSLPLELIFIILNLLDDESLENACRASDYIDKICREDAFWKSRIANRFPGAEQFIGEDKPKRFYEKLVECSPFDQKGASTPAKYGYINVLEWMKNVHHLIPNHIEASWAAMNGHLDVLRWMQETGLELPDQYGANWAAMSGRLDVLRWMQVNHCPMPDQDGANGAAQNGQLNVLRWMQVNHCPIPDQDGANGAAQNGHLNVLQWMQENHYPMPDQDGADLAAGNGHLDVLIWMKESGLALPDQAVANSVARNGFLVVLQWMQENDLGVPDQLGAAYAAYCGHLDVLEWMKVTCPLIVMSATGSWCGATPPLCSSCLALRRGVPWGLDVTE
jgi:hypothetical protein